MNPHTLGDLMKTIINFIATSLKILVVIAILGMAAIFLDLGAMFCQIHF